MPVKRRKAAVSKEEQERIAREQAEKLRLEELLRKERDAEERQEKENEKRDFEEEEERKRAKKEEQIRLLAQKDSRIVSLSTELETQKALFSAERTELETELERMLNLRETLLNDLSAIRSESDETIRNLLDDRESLVQRLESTQKDLLELKTLQAQSAADSEQERESAKVRFDAVSNDLSAISAEKEKNERELVSRITSLDREVQKLTALNTTLQEVVESREADDRKNVTLMQLLNNQLDESKRRSQEILDEERRSVTVLKQQVVTKDSSIQQLKEENDLLKREKDQLQRQAESDLHDYESKIEQLKFDMKYLHSELHSFKNQCHKQQLEVTQVRASAQVDNQNGKLEVETLQKRVEELESLLRKKDREHFDKSTFLNAQIANNRTIIAQLQQKMKSEREDHSTEIKNLSDQVESKSITIASAQSDMEKKRMASCDVEMRLSADNSILKSTVYQLQSALVDREKEMDSIISTKDEEISRLRRKLDENFIPHRNEIAASEGKAIEVVLGEKVAKLSRDLEVRNKAAHEVEARLKGQLSNQGMIIDALQAENASCRSEHEVTVHTLKDENSVLKRLLDTHCIPYKN